MYRKNRSIFWDTRRGAVIGSKQAKPISGQNPRRSAFLKFCESISQKTREQTSGRDTEELVGELNLMLKGWANYFRLGSVSKVYESVDGHVRKWLRRKHKIRVRVEKRFSDTYLYRLNGLSTAGQSWLEQMGTLHEKSF